MFKKMILLTLLTLGAISSTFALDTQTMCTMDAKLCGDGITYVGRTGPNCEFALCPDEKLVACTKEYMPVCGQPLMPTCPDGMLCTMVIPGPKSYGNSCMMKLEKATLLYKGVCGGPEVVDGLKVMIDTRVDILISRVDTMSVITLRKVGYTDMLIKLLNRKAEERPEIRNIIIYIVDKFKAYRNTLTQ